MDKISINNYTNEDYPMVIHLLSQAFKGKFKHRQRLSDEQIEAFLTKTYRIDEHQKGTINLVAKLNQRVVGSMLIKIENYPSQAMNASLFSLIKTFGFINTLLYLIKAVVLSGHRVQPGEGYIEHIAVDQDARGHGIGQKLLIAGENELKKRGMNTYSLAVTKTNPARRLYDRFGFKDFKYDSSFLRQFFVGEKNWVLMKKSLK